MIRGVRWQRGPDPGGVVPGKVQGNVLRPYGYPVSTHVFARSDQPDSGRAALAELVPQVTAGAPWIDGATIDAQHLVHVPRPRRAGSPRSAPRLLSRRVQAGDGRAGRDAG